MLKKESRVRKQKDFDRIFREKGGFFSQGDLALKMVRNNLPYARAGFIVSNKVSKSAVRRNRTKRRVREAVRLRWEGIRPGIDLVVMARADLSEKSFADVDKAVDSLLKKSGLLRK